MQGGTLQSPGELEPGGDRVLAGQGVGDLAPAGQKDWAGHGDAGWPGSPYEPAIACQQ